MAGPRDKIFGRMSNSACRSGIVFALRVPEPLRSATRFTHCMSQPTDALKKQVAEAAKHLGGVRAEVQKIVVGQQALIDRLLICLVARGHVLLEGLPGLAKTLTINSLARSSHCSFARIQFTPDLLPADITGTLIYDPVKGVYSTRQGPVFARRARCKARCSRRCRSIR